MICDACKFRNKEDSKFCQNCGSQLVKDKHIEDNAQEKRMIELEIGDDSDKGLDKERKLISKYDDVIFDPKPKSNVFPFLAILVFLAVIGLVGLAFLSSSETAPTVDDLQAENGESLLECLELSDISVSSGDSYDPKPVINAVLHNGCREGASNVVAKINIYDYGEEDPNAKPKDTQYVTLAEYIAPGDSKTINGTFETGFNTNKGFSWTVDLDSAEVL
jgi:hypothetical protein